MDKEGQEIVHGNISVGLKKSTWEILLCFANGIYYLEAGNGHLKRKSITP